MTTPERPNLKSFRLECELRYLVHSKYTLWLLDMLEEAEIIIGDMGLWGDSDTWLAEYRGDNNE